MTYDTEKGGNPASTITFNPAPSLALSILSSSHYYHNHIANKITYSKSGRKLELYYISTKSVIIVIIVTSIVIVLSTTSIVSIIGHYLQPTKAILYNLQVFYKYLSHPYTQRLQSHVVTIFNTHRPSISIYTLHQRYC